MHAVCLRSVHNFHTICHKGLTMCRQIVGGCTLGVQANCNDFVESKCSNKENMCVVTVEYGPYMS